jgi:ribosomal protein L16 Arg81 hydroxylase
LFIGGDESGPSFHAHKDAFNILYVGLKQWRVVPPLYKGITAIHSNRAQHMLNKDAILRCTQGSGDMIYLPDQWGHLIVSSGFTIGTATIAVHPLDRMIPPRDGESWAFRMWSQEVS